MSDVDFDKKDQLEKIQALAIEGETLYGVFDMYEGRWNWIHGDNGQADRIHG